MRRTLAVALLAFSAPVFAQTPDLRRSDYAGLTCEELQGEYDAAMSDMAMYAEYSGESGDTSQPSGGGPSLASMGATAMGAMGGGGPSQAMGMMASQGIAAMTAPQPSQAHDAPTAGRGGRWLTIRLQRIRDQARMKNCALVSRAPGWERRTPPPIPPSAPLDVSPEALDGAPPPDDAGAPAPDG